MMITESNNRNKVRESRNYIEKYEFYYDTDKITGRRNLIKFDILLTSYEIILADLRTIQEVKKY